MNKIFFCVVQQPRKLICCDACTTTIYWYCIIYLTQWFNAYQQYSIITNK